MIVVANRPQHLHLVAGAFTTPVAQAEPKVFTVDFRQRLALLTHAERELRALGYPVVWSRLAGPMPQLHIQRDAAVSIVPLLDRATPRTFRTRVEDDHTLASCEFTGVLVSWVQG
jgi:hypothetical protein